MLYQSTKITGSIFISIGMLIIIIAFLVPVMGLNSNSTGLNPMNAVKAISFASNFFLFIAIFFSGLHILAVGEVIYLIADIAEHNYEDNRLLKYMAKKVSIGEQE